MSLAKAVMQIHADDERRADAAESVSTVDSSLAKSSRGVGRGKRGRSASAGSCNRHGKFPRVSTKSSTTTTTTSDKDDGVDFCEFSDSNRGHSFNDNSSNLSCHPILDLDGKQIGERISTLQKPNRDFKKALQNSCKSRQGFFEDSMMNFIGGNAYRYSLTSSEWEKIEKRAKQLGEQQLFFKSIQYSDHDIVTDHESEDYDARFRLIDHAKLTKMARFQSKSGILGVLEFFYTMLDLEFVNTKTSMRIVAQNVKLCNPDLPQKYRSHENCGTNKVIIFKDSLDVTRELLHLYESATISDYIASKNMGTKRKEFGQTVKNTTAIHLSPLFSYLSCLQGITSTCAPSFKMTSCAEDGIPMPETFRNDWRSGRCEPRISSTIEDRENLISLNMALFRIYILKYKSNNSHLAALMAFRKYFDKFMEDERQKIRKILTPSSQEEDILNTRFLGTLETSTERHARFNLMVLMTRTRKFLFKNLKHRVTSVFTQLLDQYLGFLSHCPKTSTTNCNIQNYRCRDCLYSVNSAEHRLISLLLYRERVPEAYLEQRRAKMFNVVSQNQDIYIIGNFFAEHKSIDVYAYDEGSPHEELQREKKKQKAKTKSSLSSNKNVRPKLELKQRKHSTSATNDDKSAADDHAQKVAATADCDSSTNTSKQQQQLDGVGGVVVVHDNDDTTKSKQLANFTTNAFARPGTPAIGSSQHVQVFATAGSSAVVQRKQEKTPNTKTPTTEKTHQTEPDFYGKPSDFSSVWNASATHGFGNRSTGDSSSWLRDQAKCQPATEFLQWSNCSDSRRDAEIEMPAHLSTSNASFFGSTNLPAATTSCTSTATLQSQQFQSTGFDEYWTLTPSVPNSTSTAQSLLSTCVSTFPSSTTTTTTTTTAAFLSGLYDASAEPIVSIAGQSIDGLIDTATTTDVSTLDLLLEIIENC
ncbi:unnamed protein product [Oikopleura dioica]|uniref:Uncharacterized protein n=1 Tax=Oikopleura dioica TaxID=34765 RepID=E4X2A7_OIKDI|nr:unnamed protein product [Oikopleura dioica]